MQKCYTVTKQTVEAGPFKSSLVFGNPEEEPKSKSTYKQRAHSLFGVWAVRLSQCSNAPCSALALRGEDKLRGHV